MKYIKGLCALLITELYSWLINSSRAHVEAKLVEMIREADPDLRNRQMSDGRLMDCFLFNQACEYLLAVARWKIAVEENPLLPYPEYSKLTRDVVSYLSLYGDTKAFILGYYRHMATSELREKHVDELLKKNQQLSEMLQLEGEIADSFIECYEIEARNSKSLRSDLVQMQQAFEPNSRPN